MNLTIIGASAGIGLETVNQALKKGYRVTALARTATSLPDHPLLVKMNGDATVVVDLQRAIRNADAVLITIGTTHKKGTRLFSDTARALLEATSEQPFIPPVLVVTGFGSGESSRYLSWYMRLVIQLFLKDQYADKSRMEELITQSPLNWEIVRPGMLTNGLPTSSYSTLPTLYKGIKISKISRSDVADFLLREAINPTMLHQYPTLTNGYYF